MVPTFLVGPGFRLTEGSDRYQSWLTPFDPGVRDNRESGTERVHHTYLSSRSSFESYVGTEGRDRAGWVSFYVRTGNERGKRGEPLHTGLGTSKRQQRWPRVERWPRCRERFLTSRWLGWTLKGRSVLSDEGPDHKPERVCGGRNPRTGTFGWYLFLCGIREGSSSGRLVVMVPRRSSPLSPETGTPERWVQSWRCRSGYGTYSQNVYLKIVLGGYVPLASFSPSLLGRTRFETYWHPSVVLLLSCFLGCKYCLNELRMTATYNVIIPIKVWVLIR